MTPMVMTVRYRVVLLGLCMATFLAPVLLYAQGTGTSAPATISPIRVVCDDSYPPYSFRSDSGEIQGIIPDLWKAFSARTGRPVEFRAMDWTLALREMAMGHADVLDSAFRTPDREKLYDFLPAYATLKVPVYFHRSISGIAGPKDLRGFRVAVKLGDACIGILQGLGIKDLIQYTSYESIIKAATTGDVRVMCIDEPPALYYIYKYGLEDEFRGTFNLYTGYFHRAVQKNRKPLTDGSDLYAVLEKGFASIPAATIEEIEDRWMGRPLSSHIDWRIFLMSGMAVIVLVAILIAFLRVLRLQVRRKTAELLQKNQELQASERKNLAFISALPDLFFIADADGRFTEFITSNPDILMMPGEQQVGRTIDELFSDPETARLFNQNLKSALSGTPVAVIEYNMDIRGSPHHFECRATLVETDRVLFIIRDTTREWTSAIQVQQSLLEKEILLKEIHHRVKNNLQVVSSLVQLQSSVLKSEHDRQLFAETQHRILAMAQVHELLYHSDNFSWIDGGEYVRLVYDELQYAYQNSIAAVQTNLDLESVQLDLDTAIPLALILNEAVSNAFKYAFCGGRGGRLDIALKVGPDGRRVLTVADDGPGFKEDWQRHVDDSLGLTIIRSLAAQIRGTLVIENRGGAFVQLQF